MIWLALLGAGCLLVGLLVGIHLGRVDERAAAAVRVTREGETP